MFQLNVDRLLVRANARSHRYLRLTLRAPEKAARASRLPVNLAFVIDRSGSMHGEKVKHARQAVIHGIRSLSEGDHFSVAAFHDWVDVVVAAQEATREAREAAIAVVEKIEVGSNTALHAGWLKGCEQIDGQLAPEAVGRCLLLTDGLANQGVTDPDEIVRQVAAWREGRVTTTTFGVGADFDETLLRRMADAGGGNFRFIEVAAQIPDFVASEVGEALATTVREAVLVVDAGPDARVESLNGFPCDEKGGWRIPIGSLYGGQTLAPILRVSVPPGGEGQTRDVAVRVEDMDGVLAGATASVTLTYARDAVNDGQPRDIGIARQVAALVAARAERDALELNRVRDYAGARALIKACVAELDAYAQRDPEILGIVSKLLQKVDAYGGAMDAVASKTLHSLSSQTLSGRLARMTAPPVVGSSGYIVVPSEWEVLAAVEAALARAAAGNPALASLDAKGLARTLAHIDRRRCVLDPSQTPGGEVELSFEAPDFCTSCRGKLEASRLDDPEVKDLAAALRLLRTPSGVVH